MPLAHLFQTCGSGGGPYEYSAMARCYVRLQLLLLVVVVLVKVTGHTFKGEGMASCLTPVVLSHLSSATWVKVVGFLAAAFSVTHYYSIRTVSLALY